MRWVVIGIAVVYLGVAAILFALGMDNCVLIWLVFQGCFLLAAIFFERWRYRPRVNRSSGRWQATGERFVDPSSGRLMEVFYNPDTGERDYVDIGDKLH